jgi:hypothetical protein
VSAAGGEQLTGIVVVAGGAGGQGRVRIIDLRDQDVGELLLDVREARDLVRQLDRALIIAEGQHPAQRGC